MRRSRSQRPKARKNGPSIPTWQPATARKTANASAQASETAVNQEAGTTLRRPTEGAPRSGWKNLVQNLETRRTGELPDRREEAIGDGKATQATSRQTNSREGRGAIPNRHTRRSRRSTNAPDRLRSSLAEDRDAPGRGERSKSQEEPPVRAPPSACLDREGEASVRSTSANLRKSDSAIPDDAKSRQKKETYIWRTL